MSAEKRKPALAAPVLKNEKPDGGESTPEPRFRVTPRMKRERTFEDDVLADAAKIERRIAASPQKADLGRWLHLWGRVRDLGRDVEGGKMPPLPRWREHLQPFQVEHLRRYIPILVEYLAAIQKDLDEDEAATLVLDPAGAKEATP